MKSVTRECCLYRTMGGGGEHGAAQGKSLKVGKLTASKLSYLPEFFNLDIDISPAPCWAFKKVVFCVERQKGQAFRWRKHLQIFCISRSKLKNIYTTLYWRAGLGWAGLGAVISPLIYSGQMMNVSPVPVTLRRCSLLTWARNEPSRRFKFHGIVPIRLSLMTLVSTSQFHIYFLWVNACLA